MKRPILALPLAALALGCDRPPAPTTSDASASSAVGSANPKAVALDPKVIAALRESSITNVSYARRVFWSWTTPDQVELLRKEKQLLIPGELPSGPTPYVQLLEKS